MALTNIFDRGPLQQDTGSLKPRYAQEGSTVVGATETLTATTGLYTPPSGKTLYITDVSVQLVSVTPNTTTYFRDAYDGTPILRFDIDSYTGGEILSWHFDTPLTVSVWPHTWGYYKVGTATIIVNWSGWIE